MWCSPNIEKLLVCQIKYSRVRSLTMCMDARRSRVLCLGIVAYKNMSFESLNWCGANICVKQYGICGILVEMYTRTTFEVVCQHGG